MSNVVEHVTVIDDTLRRHHKNHTAIQDSKNPVIFAKRVTEAPELPELGTTEYMNRLVGMIHKWWDVDRVAEDIGRMLDREYFTKRMTFEERAVDVLYCNQILASIRAIPNESHQMLYAVRLLDQMREKLKYITPRRKFHDLRHLSY